MSKRYTDLDELIKDISGPNSKFYKDWMKGKAKRERYVEEFLNKLMLRMDKEEAQKKRTATKKKAKSATKRRTR